MADSSQLTSTWQKTLTWFSALAAGVAALMAVWAYDLSRVAQREVVFESFQAYTPSVDKSADFVLSSPKKVLSIEKISLTPRFNVPSKYSDTDTLGSAVVFPLDEIRVETVGSGESVRVVGALQTICNEQRANIEKCRAGYPIQQIYFQYWLSSGDTYSGWFDAL